MADRPSCLDRETAPVDDLLRAAEITGASWARAGLDVHARIRERARFWPGGRTGRLKLILAALDGARRAGGAQ